MIQMLYLEAMEETQNDGREPYATGDTGMAGVGGKQLPKSLLAHDKEWSRSEGNLKRKTRTVGMLASLTGTSLCTYAIEPPCTEPYARWCGRSAIKLMDNL